MDLFRVNFISKLVIYILNCTYYNTSCHIHPFVILLSAKVPFSIRRLKISGTARKKALTGYHFSVLDKVEFYGWRKIFSAVGGSSDFSEPSGYHSFSIYLNERKIHWERLKYEKYASSKTYTYILLFKDIDRTNKEIV